MARKKLTIEAIVCDMCAESVQKPITLQLHTQSGSRTYDICASCTTSLLTVLDANVDHTDEAVVEEDDDDEEDEYLNEVEEVIPDTIPDVKGGGDTNKKSEDNISGIIQGEESEAAVRRSLDRMAINRAKPNKYVDHNPHDEPLKRTTQEYDEFLSAHRVPADINNQEVKEKMRERYLKSFKESESFEGGKVRVRFDPKGY